MTTADRASFLKEPYSGYQHRDVPSEDAELTHVGPNTPCGEYLRRFWHPVIRSADIQDLPKRLRIMGEDLVAFRDRSGRVGLLELHCAHRGASLEFGVIAEHGIRCCYHGWLFDIDGRLLETPGEQGKSAYKDKLYQGAYPVVERQGLVFAYMGPPDRKPPFPELDTFSLPGYRCIPGRRHLQPCNWLQVKENCMDPAHLAFLHTIISGAQFTPAFGILPPTEFVGTSCGMAYISPRRVGDHIWVRISDFIPPNIHQFGGIEDGRKEKLGRPHMTLWAVPVDDTSTINTGILHLPKDMEVDHKQLHELIESFGQTAERPYEERQRQPGDYDAQTSQRPIAVHGMEHLATTDRGVVLLRRMIREGIRAVAAGKDPYGVDLGKDGKIRTYGQDAVLRIPAAPDPEADRRLLVETGRKVVDDHYIKNPPAFVTQKMLRDIGF